MKKFPFLFVLSTLFFSARFVSAADFTVSNAAELQAALNEAQNNDQDDVIHLKAGEYKLSENNGQPFVYLADDGSADMTEENFSLTLEGEGADSTILDGENLNVLMYLDTVNVFNDAPAKLIVKKISFRRGSPGADAAGGLTIFANAASATIEDSLFEQNQSIVGGVAVISGSGNIDLIRNKILQNRPDDVNVNVSVGGAYLVAGGTVRVEQNIFFENQSNNGQIFPAGGAYISGPLASIKNNLFAKNKDESGSPLGVGGVYVYSVFEGTISNNTITENGGDFGGGIGVVLPEKGSLNIQNNIVYENDGVDIHLDDDPAGTPPTVTVRNNDFFGLISDCDNNSGCSPNPNYLSADNFFADPLFVDSENSNYHLTENSPCLDQGIDGDENDVDFEGDPRVLGQAVDVGADEFSPCGDGVVSVGAGEACDGGDNCDAECQVVSSENPSPSASPDAETGVPRGGACSLNENATNSAFSWVSLIFFVGLLAMSRIQFAIKDK